MAEEHTIPGSHIKLVATATGGVPAEHSSYYRRMVSAGYKGHIQGTIAGASLYGIIGAGVGVLAAFGISLITGGTAFIPVIPLFAGYGVIKGASTFGQIGSNAAQLAEYAEMNERRRALLDRLGETQSKEEANEIRQILNADTMDKVPEKFIHPRTALVGAIIGAVAIGALVYFGLTPELINTGFGQTLLHGIQSVAAGVVTESAAGILSLAGTAGLSAKLIGIASVIGATAGATIGIDRGWIRRWFDISEGTVHQRDYYENMAQQRAIETSRLHKISANELQEIAVEQPAISRAEPAVMKPDTPATMNIPQTNVAALSAIGHGRIGDVEISKTIR